MNTSRKCFIVSEDAEIILNNKRMLLEKGDKVVLEMSNKSKATLDKEGMLYKIFNFWDLDGDAHSDSLARELWDKKNNMNDNEFTKFYKNVMNGSIKPLDITPKFSI